jgi:predicted MFS family arabinose efflux permease
MPARSSTAIRLLQLTAFASTFDRFAMPPMLVAISVDLDAPLSQVVTAASLYFLVYGVMQPVWGFVSDSLGRVRTMRLTLFLAGLATISSAFATSTAGLGVARAVAGAFFGAAYPASLIYIGDTVPAARRQPEVARLMVGVALGTAAASVGAGLLADVSTWRAAFVVTGVAALGLCWALGRLPEPPGRADRAGRSGGPLLQVARNPRVVLVLSLAFVEGAVLLGVLTLLPAAVQSTGASETLAGAVTAAYGVAVFGWAWLVSRLSRGLHPSRLIALGASAAVTGCLVLAASRQAPAALVVSVLLALAWTFMHSSLQTWATEVAPAYRATVVSLFAASLFVGSAAAAAAVAGLAEVERYREIFLLAAVAAVPLGVVATWARATGSSVRVARQTEA